MRVSVAERNNPTALMQGDLDSSIYQSNNAHVIEHQLKVDRDATSDVLFRNLKYRDFQSLNVNGNGFKDFYYLARDGVSYIFSTRP